MSKHLTASAQLFFGLENENEKPAGQTETVPVPKDRRRAQRVNKDYYLEVMRHLREAIRKKRPEL